jgi:S-adenosylmethionine:tRNA ribosyltransferase-isomerase
MQGGEIEIELMFSGTIHAVLDRYGEMPLPPYIKRNTEDYDKTRYQTVYATHTGSVAAPTAGLHFTKEILEQLSHKGIDIAFVTLHVGYGTFAPIRCQDIRQHRIHEEFVTIPEETAEAVRKCRQNRGRVFAAGTTSVRSLEYAASHNGLVKVMSGNCGLYITPGYQFKVVDAIITNFHLPCSSLLVLVSAFA